MELALGRRLGFRRVLEARNEELEAGSPPDAESRTHVLLVEAGERGETARLAVDSGVAAALGHLLRPGGARERRENRTEEESGGPSHASLPWIKRPGSLPDSIRRELKVAMRGPKGAAGEIIVPEKRQPYEP